MFVLYYDDRDDKFYTQPADEFLKRNDCFDLLILKVDPKRDYLEYYIECLCTAALSALKKKNNERKRTSN